MKALERTMPRGSAAVWFNRKRLAFFLLAILAVLQGMPLNAAVTLVAPEWKAHFKRKLVIENCVFTEINSSWGRTNLYQVRYQEDASLMREIGNPDDAAVDHITGGNVYAGRLGSNYWAIEGGRVLKLFPNADDLIREFRNPEVSLIEAPRRRLIGALFYGFHLLDPSSMEWLDESTFRASSFRGDKFRGVIREAPGGLPTVLEWHAEADPGIQFTTECKYASKFDDLPYYPSEIFLLGTVNGKTMAVTAYRILALKTARESLPATWFDSARYFSPSASSVPQILMVTNNQLYAKNNGR
jgi:hypothetical protein